MIRLKIWHEEGESELHLHAENMNELIDVKLPEWLPTMKDLTFMQENTARFKKDFDGETKKELDSGWYYIKDEQ
jgi:hypothetical protein